MPTYEYECKKCGVFEVEQRITEDALKTCPTCGKKQPIVKLVSAPAFHLKGGGWYKDAYAGTSNKASTEKAKPAESTAATVTASSESSSTTKKEEKKSLKTTGGCGSGGCGC